VIPHAPTIKPSIALNWYHQTSCESVNIDQKEELNEAQIKLYKPPIIHNIPPISNIIPAAIGIDGSGGLSE
jgi:hypothetical protein